MGARKEARDDEEPAGPATNPVEELRRQEERAGRSSRELTASETAAALTDELSQPLTAILANAQALLRTYAKRPQVDPELQDAIEDVTREAFRAAKIIHRMRVLVRRREARKRRLDVNEAIRSIAGLIHAEATERGVGLTFDLAPSLPESLVDAIQIQQVLLSLVRNSFDAMMTLPPGERVMRVRTAAAGEVIAVTIEDAGPPIDDDTLTRFFTPFYTSKADGLGIGLSMCRSIVEAHRGRIDVVRNAGPGLTVRFYLPVAI
jgi:C4-dicarboxylate-specific signal transduction histidine kinase